MSIGAHANKQVHIIHPFFNWFSLGFFSWNLFPNISKKLYGAFHCLTGHNFTVLFHSHGSHSTVFSCSRQLFYVKKH